MPIAASAKYAGQNSSSESAPPKKWVVADPHPLQREWAAQLNLSPITAQVLLNRLTKSEHDAPPNLDTASVYLNPQWDRLSDPDLLPDVAVVADRLASAIANREPVVVYGDYDVDGIAGTALLWHALRLAGAEVDYYIPHRQSEGYGLHAEALAELAGRGAKVIVTVDCGTTAVAAAEAARELGLDLLITDHHQPDAVLPAALAVVNPNRADSAAPDRDLCGAGVALKVAWALGRKLAGTRRVSPEYRQFLISAAGLAALATVADVVPLSPENRILTAMGLPGLAASRNPGIAALLRSTGLSDRVDAEDAGYKLGPRLNAMGRLGHAKLAVEMLTTATPERAAEIADYLRAQNEERKKVERNMLIHAHEKIRKGRADLDAERAIVLHDEDWHQGVVGLVAGRLAQEYTRPTVLLWVKGDTAGGSARSVAGFDVHAALLACREFTTTSGGHAMAGGLKLATAHIPAFAAAFQTYCRQHLTPEMMVPKLRIDAEVRLAQLNDSVVRELRRLAPFGNGNPEPVLMAAGVTVIGAPRIMKDVHLSFQASQAGRGLRCVFWRAAERTRDLYDGAAIDIAFVPKLNEFQGRRSVELEIRELRRADRAGP